MFPNQITMEDAYVPISNYYNLLSKLYSLGRIPQCRDGFVEEIGDAVLNEADGDVSVCYVGVGHGDEAVNAAECGAMVTVVDVSASMLERFQVKLDSLGGEVRSRVRLIHGDVRNMEGRYDWIVANFFLNVFSEGEMVKMLERVLGLCKDGGSLVIGDFCHTGDGGMVVRSMQRLNWYVALLVFRMFVKNAKHSIYCYEGDLFKLGWKVEERKVFGFFGVSFYESVRFKSCCDND